jgi:hypothetical protein
VTVATANTNAGSVVYRTEYSNITTSQTVSFEGKKEQIGALEEPPVLEYVEVRLTDDPIASTAGPAEKKENYQEKGRGHSYIRILSPAVSEALRCVVDYFPSVDLSGSIIKVHEPFAIFIFFEQEITEYRKRLEYDTQEDALVSCPNRYASKHIAIAQDFVMERTRDAINAERERHARGYATFDMLWLLYKPGADIFFDFDNVGEHDPFIVKAVDFDLINGKTNVYRASYWNMNANSEWVGAAQFTSTIERFAGEKEIVSLRAYPCEYLRFAKDVDDGDLRAIKDHFINRGKTWYGLRRKTRCYKFDGRTTTYPRRNVSYVDPSKIDSRTNLSSLVCYPGYGRPHTVCHVGGD